MESVGRLPTVLGGIKFTRYLHDVGYEASCSHVFSFSLFRCFRRQPVSRERYEQVLYYIAEKHPNVLGNVVSPC
jgi:hypothetical protein